MGYGGRGFTYHSCPWIIFRVKARVFKWFQSIFRECINKGCDRWNGMPNGIEGKFVEASTRAGEGQNSAESGVLSLRRIVPV